MPDNFYLGYYVADLLPMFDGKVQLCYGIWGATTLLTFSTLFVFMARYAERWDAVRAKERDMHNAVGMAISHLDQVLGGVGAYRYQGIRSLLKNHLVPLLHNVAQIELPRSIGSDKTAEAVVHKEWRSLPRRLADCFCTLQRDDPLSLGVFFVQLSRILYSIRNALSIAELAGSPYARRAREIIEAEGGMLDELVATANECGKTTIVGLEAQRVREGDAFVPWLHITSELSPGTALKKGLPVVSVHSIYLKTPDAVGIEYRAKVEVPSQVGGAPQEQSS